MISSRGLRSIVAVLIGAACLATVSAARLGAPSATVTVIDGGTLIDGTGSPPLANAVIVIRGNRIAAVGRSGEVKIPPDAHRIDATGKFIIPGLIDAHEHMRDWMNDLYLVHGVTTILDADSPADWIFAQKEGIEKGKIRGPRILAAGIGFRCSGAGCRSKEFEPDSLRQQVRGLAGMGASQIYVGQEVPPAALQAIIDEAHHLGLPVSGPSFYAREALSAGIDCLVHTYAIVLAALPLSQRNEILRRGNNQALSMAQSDPVEILSRQEGKQLMAQLLRSKVYLIPILSEDMKSLHPHQDEFRRDNARVLDNPELEYLPKAVLYPQLLSPGDAGVALLAGGLFRFGGAEPGSSQERQDQQDYTIIQTFLREYVQAGGKVLAGSDPPNFALPGVGLYHELQLLVDAGLSPMQALQAATLWPAQYVKKADEIGNLRPGRFADLVVLDANPLSDIRNISKVGMVFKNGTPEDLHLHRGYSNPIPYPPRSKRVPSISEITPGVVVQQSGPVELTVRGSGFVPVRIIKGSSIILPSVLKFDGVRIPTRVVNTTELRGTIPPYLTARVGTFRITVENPGDRGGTSGPAYMIVKFK
jgi:Amidohydrolase family